MSALFQFEDGEPLFKPRKVNAQGKTLCEHDDCYNVVHNKGRNHGGYLTVCKAHYRGEKAIRGGYRAFKLDFCENTDGRLGFKCTTTIMDDSMLTMDHIDNNHENNEPENLQTLCACCHNYKTRFYDSNKNGLKAILAIFTRNRRKVAQSTG